MRSGRASAAARAKNERIARLEAELETKRQVIAEVTEENLAQKKGSGIGFGHARQRSGEARGPGPGGADHRADRLDDLSHSREALDIDVALSLLAASCEACEAGRSSDGRGKESRSALARGEAFGNSLRPGPPEGRLPSARLADDRREHRVPLSFERLPGLERRRSALSLEAEYEERRGATQADAAQ